MEKDLVGRTITVRIPDRDMNGKLMKDKFTTIKGKCTYYGINFFGDMSITINRTPVYPITDIDIIKIE
jgi:hypothetical protein